MPRPGPRPYECIRRAWHSDSHQPLRGSLTQEIFRVVTEFHSAETRSKKEWQEKLPIVVLRAEDILYSKARTEAEYTDLSTLKPRLEDAVNTMIRRTDDSNDKDGPYMEPCVEAALSLGCTPKTNPRGQRSCTARLASASNVKRASPMSSSTSSKEASTVNQNQNVASYLMSTSRADMESGNAPGKPTACVWPKPMAQGPLPFPQLVVPANNVYNMNGGYPSSTVQQQQQQHVRSSPVVRPEFRDELKGSQFVSMTPFNHGSFGMVCPQPLDPALRFRLQQQQPQQQQYSLNRDEVTTPSVCFEAAEPAKARNNGNPFEPLRPLCCPVTKYSGAAPFQANSVLGPSIFPNLSTTPQRQSSTIPPDCIRSQREVAEADLELCLAPPKTSFHQSRIHLDVAESCTTSGLSWQSEGLNSLQAGVDAAGLACSKRKPLPIGAAGKCYDTNIEIFEANKRHREFPY